MDESGSTFTSSHTTFARLCLEARAYTAALPVLDHNIFHFPPTTNKSAENSMFPHLSSHHDSSSTFITPDSGLSAKLEYRDHLIYFLYGAMIFMGLKKWKRALHFLEIVIMSPMVSNVSKIQVDAYKKWVLVSLLYKGHVSDAYYLEVLPELFLTISSAAIGLAQNNKSTGYKAISCNLQGL